MKVLEIGGGNSTLWFLAQGAHVTTIEPNGRWADAIHARAIDAERLNLVVLKGEDALAFLAGLSPASFDVALIDSWNADLRRNDCIPIVRDKVAPGGWLILDDTDHPYNWAGVDAMAGHSRERHVGYAPMSLTVNETSLWHQGSDSR
jgi:predicted O-methyltransferase YrrM